MNTDELTKSGQLEVTVQLKNAGARKGEEVVQLYIQDIAASHTRPIKELKGFQKVLLASGVSQPIRFQLSAKDLAFYSNGKWVSQTGQFKVFVGGNSRDVLEASFTLKE
ncbi:MAG: fibronectin type III-like domain-contianing protein [Bacteroidota bacterium]